MHLGIRGIGDRTIGLSTRELATVPGTNRLPGNMARQELERCCVTEVGVRHGRMVGKAGRWLAKVEKRVDGDSSSSSEP